MARDETPRADAPADETLVNGGLQTPAPGLDDDDDGNPNPIDPDAEPMNTVDRDDQPVADRAQGVVGLWDRQDADPDEVLETGDDVEIRHIPGGSDNG